MKNLKKWIGIFFLFSTLSNASSCDFDMDTGYSYTKVYINDEHKSYILIGVHDPRYGTTEYVYNGNTCESITSGSAGQSSYEHILKKNGFRQTMYQGKASRYNEIEVMDDWFGTLTTLALNPSDDKITLVTELIDSNIKNELNNALRSVANRNNNHVMLSNNSKNMILHTNKFKRMLENKIGKLSANNINYAYTLSLLSQVNTLKSLKQLLAYNYFHSKYYKNFSEHASNNFLSFLRGSETDDIYYKFIKIKKPTMNIKEKEKSYLITVDSENKYNISYTINKQCNTSYSNRQTKREVEDNGDIYNRTYQDKTYGCSIIGGIASSRSDLNTLFSTLAQNRGFTYKKSFLPKNNLITSTNRERIDSKYVGVDKVKEAKYKKSQCDGLYLGKSLRYPLTGFWGTSNYEAVIVGLDQSENGATIRFIDTLVNGGHYLNVSCTDIKYK